MARDGGQKAPGELTVHAAYRRTFQTRPYETQAIELSVWMGLEQAGSGSEALKRLNAASRLLYKDLEAVGDKLMAEALAKPDPRDAGEER